MIYDVKAARISYPVRNSRTTTALSKPPENSQYNNIVDKWFGAWGDYYFSYLSIRYPSASSFFLYAFPWFVVEKEGFKERVKWIKTASKYSDSWVIRRDKNSVYYNRLQCYEPKFLDFSTQCWDSLTKLFIFVSN